jgi:RND family efflux transporter MFP subunit
MKNKGFILLVFTTMLLVACTEQADLEKKLAELKAKKTEMSNLKVEIEQLETEIAALDPEFARMNRKATLISTMKIEKKDFVHYVEVSGAIESRKNVTITAETIGTIEEILVNEGQFVRTGQVLIKLENASLMNSYDEVKTSYELAKTVYEKQENLWKQNIGSEVQYLESKNRKESLEQQMKSIKTQIAKTIITAPFSGTIDQLDAKLGMLAQPSVPLAQLVSMDELYIKADVSEAYIGQFEKGNTVNVSFPSNNKSFNSKITAIGQIVNRDNRTFSIEVKVPGLGFAVKPNMIAVIRIKDYESKNATVVPTKLIQKDGRGDFVFIVDSEADTPTAKKVKVKRGRTYNNQTQILEGLQGNELLVDQGFRDVSEGINVKIVESTI